MTPTNPPSYNFTTPESPEAVALILALKIGDTDPLSGGGRQDRAYWLKLYAECLAAVKKEA